ncbi:uncharacterized protein M6B38_191115 [Iris pallida]|uniref:Uncharacterized protein n=1 Tax=Iris pallida TaxID=29817 RepID=A0AAX6EFJ5_IRIPA|nr:uncharacterized protein M6B38_191115 [Iris pallida]
MSGFGPLPAARRVQGSSDLAAATTLSVLTSMILRSTTLSGGKGLPGKCNCLHTNWCWAGYLLGTDCFGSGFLSLTLSVFYVRQRLNPLGTCSFSAMWRGASGQSRAGDTWEGLEGSVTSEKSLSGLVIAGARSRAGLGVLD